MLESAIRITHPATGPRVYVFGARIHHGLTGCLLAAIGAALAWADRHDFPWVKDR